MLVGTRERVVLELGSIFRDRPETELSNQSFKPGEYNQSELMEHGYIVGHIGLKSNNRSPL